MRPLDSGGVWLGLEVLHQPGKRKLFAAALDHQLIYLVEFCLQKVQLIERKICLRTQLPCGSFRSTKEFYEHCLSPTFKAFGDIRHDGDSRPPHLISQTEVLC